MESFKMIVFRSIRSKPRDFSGIQFASAAKVCAAVLFVFASLGSSGCGGYSSAKHQVESTKARSTLETVLKSWQEGVSPDSLQEKKPKIVVQDMDWKAGTKLHAFEILGEGNAVDANLYCKVKLQVESPGKGKSEKTVTYLIGTSPVLTVFRSVEP